SERYIRAIWTQIAENFASYGDSLVFESMNEPRLAGTGKEWWFADNDPEGVASIEVIVKLNQVFVDTVRSSGGMNASRFLMVPSNAAAPQNALNAAFTMPNDPAGEGRLLVSVHAYSPYDFAMNASGYSTWDGSRANELSFMDQLNEKFIKNGYGVVIGEFGATNKDNLADRVAWATDYTGKAASLGIPCFLWDNGGTRVGSENFGMIDRNSLSVYYGDILNAMLASYAY
ncbi:MAG: glycoside hydrolase family 5 protein, partial [Oscillospiraceae bacterium]